MAIRSPTEYRSGLDDDRVVFVRGERVNVLDHPGFRIPLAHSANIYELAMDRDSSDLFTFDWDGETTNRYFETIESQAALARRSELIVEHTRQGRATLNLTKAVGSDALAGLTSTGYNLASSGDRKYLERVTDYRHYCAKHDLSIAVAQTDVKGDRSLPPEAQQDPDMYVRIVDRRPDGIVVRGAKAHTTMAPLVDEIIVLPTRSMDAASADYAVSFATPVDAEGIVMISGPLPNPDVSTFDKPVSSRNVEMETITVFEDLFVPNERVFLAGEPTYAGQLAMAFATFHRFTAISYKLPMAELLLGCAVEIAEHNGIARMPHVRDKIAHIAFYGQLLRSCVVAAVELAEELECGLMLPNPAATSAGKYHFSSGYHAVVQTLQDLAGGFAITAPWEADLDSANTGFLVKKYLAGAVGTDAERRLRLFQLIRDVTASDFAGYNEVVTLHGEGSMRAQLLQLLNATDFGAARLAVEHALSENPLG